MTGAVVPSMNVWSLSRFPTGPSVSEGTVWGAFAREAVETSDPMIGIKLDLEKITSLFAKMTLPGQKPGAAGGATAKAPSSPGKPTILTQQRATNMGITFTKLKVSAFLLKYSSYCLVKEENHGSLSFRMTSCPNRKSRPCFWSWPVLSTWIGH